MEKWNLYDHNGHLTDKIHLRGEPIPSGYYHLVIHIWLRDELGRFLIQQRSSNVESFPGVWAATGGSAIMGESSLDAVIRETQEELGFTPAEQDLQLIDRLWRRTHILDLWLTTIPSDFENHFRPTPEVDAVAFKYPDEIVQMHKQGQFFKYPKDYFDTLNITL